MASGQRYTTYEPQLSDLSAQSGTACDEHLMPGEVAAYIQGLRAICIKGITNAVEHSVLG